MITTSLFFFTLCEIVKIVYCGNSPLNPFALQANQESKNFELDKENENFFFEDGAIKNLKRKRLFFPGNDITDVHPDKLSTLNDEYPFRTTENQSKTEEEHRFSGEVGDSERDRWENENSFSIMEQKGNIGNSMEYRSRQPPTGPYHKYNLQKSDIFKKSQSKWNNEKNYEHVEEPNSGIGFGTPYAGRAFNDNINYNSVGRSSNILDRKISITTLNEQEARNVKKYNNNYKLGERQYGYDFHSNMDKLNKNDNGFWDPHSYKSEKGVIINLNTECPVARQFNNRFLHKIIFSPKSSVDTHSELSVYQFPGPGLISAHQPTSTYFY